VPGGEVRLLKVPHTHTLGASPVTESRLPETRKWGRGGSINFLHDWALGQVQRKPSKHPKTFLGQILHSYTTNTRLSGNPSFLWTGNRMLWAWVSDRHFHSMSTDRLSARFYFDRSTWTNPKWNVVSVSEFGVDVEAIITLTRGVFIMIRLWSENSTYGMSLASLANYIKFRTETSL